MELIELMIFTYITIMHIYIKQQAQKITYQNQKLLKE